MRLLWKTAIEATIRADQTVLSAYPPEAPQWTARETFVLELIEAQQDLLA